jgi:hypothetical protein
MEMGTVADEHGPSERLHTPHRLLVLLFLLLLLLLLLRMITLYRLTTGMALASNSRLTWGLQWLR